MGNYPPFQLGTLARASPSIDGISPWTRRMRGWLQAAIHIPSPLSWRLSYALLKRKKKSFSPSLQQMRMTKKWLAENIDRVWAGGREPPSFPTNPLGPRLDGKKTDQAKRHHPLWLEAQQYKSIYYWSRQNRKRSVSVGPVRELISLVSRGFPRQDPVLVVARKEKKKRRAWQKVGGSNRRGTKVWTNHMSEAPNGEQDARVVLPRFDRALHIHTDEELKPRAINDAWSMMMITFKSVRPVKSTHID